MTAAEAMKSVEELKFAVRVGLANSFRVFLRNISSEPTVVELLDLSRSRHVALEVLKRITSLSKLRTDFRYLNRFDLALATYLWVLSRTFPELARAGAEVTTDLPRTWWTEQVTRYILEEWSQKPTSSTAADVRIISRNLGNVSTSNAAATTTSLSFSSSLVDFAQTKGSSIASSSEDAVVVRGNNEGGNETSLVLSTNTGSTLVERK